MSETGNKNQPTHNDMPDGVEWKESTDDDWDDDDDWQEDDWGEMRTTGTTITGTKTTTAGMMKTKT